MSYAPRFSCQSRALLTFIPQVLSPMLKVHLQVYRCTCIWAGEYHDHAPRVRFAVSWALSILPPRAQLQKWSKIQAQTDTSNSVTSNVRIVCSLRCFEICRACVRMSVVRFTRPRARSAYGQQFAYDHSSTKVIGDTIPSTTLMTLCIIIRRACACSPVQNSPHASDVRWHITVHGTAPECFPSTQPYSLRAGASMRCIVEPLKGICAPDCPRLRAEQGRWCASCLRASRSMPTRPRSHSTRASWWSTQGPSRPLAPTS